jgi:hypothetical protein
LEIKIERDGGVLRGKREIERRGTGPLEDLEGRDGIGGDVKETPTARYTYLSYTVFTALPYDQILCP